uniref:Uncharacterized protein n=1 Tax=Cucumis melo TaxID=3656 RepID=A0A9I9CYP8_CUCME
MGVGAGLQLGVPANRSGQCRSRSRATLGLPVVVRGSINRAAAGATCQVGVRRDMFRLTGG